MIDIQSGNFRPSNEVRGFVHKRLLGAAKGLVTGGPLAALGGFLVTDAPVRMGKPSATARDPVTGLLPRKAFGSGPGALIAFQNQPQVGVSSVMAGGTCKGIAWVRTDVGCVHLATGETRPFDNGHGGPVGEAVMGQYGPALVPGNRPTNTRVCLPGMVLGKDRNCYNKRDISNKERLYPRGAKPLGTPEEIRATRIAKRFAGRLETKVKAFQKSGLIKKPAPRRRITSGPTEHHHHG